MMTSFDIAQPECTVATHGSCNRPTILRASLASISNSRSNGCFGLGGQRHRRRDQTFVLGGLVTAVVFSSVGLLITWPAIAQRRMAAAAMHGRWSSRVVSTDVLKKVFRSQDSDFDYFVPRIRYEYMTNGIRREGDVVRIGLDEMGYPLEKQAREHIARYPPGAKIPVRYDRHAPERAVLEAGHTGVTRKILAGFILLGLAIAALALPSGAPVCRPDEGSAVAPGRRRRQCREPISVRRIGLPPALARVVQKSDAARRDVAINVIASA